VRGVGIAPQVPHHLDVHRAGVKRQLARDQLAGDASGTEERQRQHGQQVRLGDHAARGEELVHGQHDAALASDVGERTIDSLLRPPRETDPEVLRSAERLERQLLARQRMVAPHHADVARLVQPRVPQRGVRALCHQRGDHLAKVAHREVGLSLLQQRPRVTRAQRQHAHVGRRVGALDRTHQRRRQQGGGGVGHRDAEVDRLCARVEARRRQRVLQARQRRAHRRPQRLRLRRRPHAAGGAREQPLAERLVQALQRVARGRLRHRQHAGGARQAALGHHGIEHAQQVEIQRAEVHARGP
jgi:hypothetical protein